MQAVEPRRHGNRRRIRRFADELEQIGGGERCDERCRPGENPAQPRHHRLAATSHTRERIDRSREQRQQEAEREDGYRPLRQVLLGDSDERRRLFGHRTRRVVGEHGPQRRAAETAEPVRARRDLSLRRQLAAARQPHRVEPRVDERRLVADPHGEREPRELAGGAGTVAGATALDLLVDGLGDGPLEARAAARRRLAPWDGQRSAGRVRDAEVRQNDHR